MRARSWIQKAKLTWRVLLHPNTPFAAKAAAIGAVFYGLLPFDFVPDVLPLIGVLDDATLLIVGFLIFQYLSKAVRREVKREL